MFTSQYIEDLSTSVLAKIYNDLILHTPDGTAPVKRFSDKESAVRRTLAVLNDEETDLQAFAKKHEDWAEMLGMKKERSKPKTKAVAKAKAKGKEEGEATKPRKAPQGDDAKHFNLRCPNDGYVLKTAKLYLDWARPLCPVCNAMMLTAVERKELKEKGV